jgi:hypothetical protein
VLALIWAIVAAALLWRARWRPAQRRLMIWLGLVTGSLLVLLLVDGVWSLMPRSLRHIQFTFRLETYIVFAISGLLMLLLATLGGERRGTMRYRGLVTSLGAVVLLGLGFGCWQGWNSDAGYWRVSRTFLRNRSAVFRYPHSTPPTWYVYGIFRSFRDYSAPVVATDGTIAVDPAAVHGDDFKAEVAIPRGTGPVATNIAAAGYLVTVRGLRVAGRTQPGFVALQRPAQPRKRVRLEISLAHTIPLRVAPFVTLLGLVGLCSLTIASALLGRRRRSRF